MTMAIVALAACEFSASDKSSAGADGTGDNVVAPAPLGSASASSINAAIREIETWSMVREIMYDPELVVPWTIGVEDDGSRRSGLAESVCMELESQGALVEGDTVRIVDRSAVLANGGDFRAASLAHIECASGRNLGV
ncbi:hypothetical protein AAG607_13810 [Citromicrobium bathyomarinum]|uniref:hypothetical protein n=1 Tax=Citromicrobium bathyomarinum TaxID=72174 RepID=UPI003159F94C